LLAPLRRHMRALAPLRRHMRARAGWSTPSLLQALSKLLVGEQMHVPLQPHPLPPLTMLAPLHAAQRFLTALTQAVEVQVELTAQASITTSQRMRRVGNQTSLAPTPQRGLVLEALEPAALHLLHLLHLPTARLLRPLNPGDGLGCSREACAPSA